MNSHYYLFTDVGLLIRKEISSKGQTIGSLPCNRKKIRWLRLLTTPISINHGASCFSITAVHFIEEKWKNTGNINSVATKKPEAGWGESSHFPFILVESVNKHCIFYNTESIQYTVL